jgi:hypothetical protein
MQSIFLGAQPREERTLRRDDAVAKDAPESVLICSRRLGRVDVERGASPREHALIAETAGDFRQLASGDRLNAV